MRPEKNVSSSFESRLEGYSKTSKAALKKSPTLGVAMAALAIGTTESEAAISVTVLNDPIIAGSNTTLNIAGFGDVSLDFEFQGDSSSSNFVKMGAHNGNRFIGRTSGTLSYASLLASGASVGAGGTGDFLPTISAGVVNTMAFDYSAGSQGGDWLGGATGFIGILVQTGADVNYGWIEVTVNADNASGTIIRYGIESDVNTAIQAGATAAVPEPNSLACLAIGAAGLLRWRQRRKVA